MIGNALGTRRRSEGSVVKVTDCGYRRNAVSEDSWYVELMKQAFFQC